MTETRRRRRSGGRAGRQATRQAASSTPFLTRSLTPFELVSEEGLALLEENADTILEQVGVDFRITRSPWSCWPRPAPTSTVNGCGSPVACAADRVGERADRPTPSTRGTTREPCRSAETPPCSPPTTGRRSSRPRRRSPLRNARGLRELREARVPVAIAPPLRWNGVRAGRRAGQQAPPRHGLRPHPLQRQAVHGVGHGRASEPRTRWSWPASRSAATSPTAP